jgi:hypothetical protein
LPYVEGSVKTLSGFNALRWLTLTRGIKVEDRGFESKIHNKEYVSLVVNGQEERVQPLELILRQLEAIYPDIPVYQRRVLEENVARRLREQIHALVDPTDEQSSLIPLKKTTPLEHIPQLEALISLCDKVSHQCLLRQYKGLSIEELKLVKTVSDVFSGEPSVVKAVAYITNYLEFC